MLFSLAAIGGNIVTELTGALGDVWYAVLINFIGVVAIAIKITETQNKKRNRIVLFAVLGHTCWTTYFVLNGNFTSAMVNVVGCIQGLVFMQRGKYKWANSIFWLFFFLAIQVALSIFTWNGPFSLFSIFGGLISTVAYFVMNEKVYRYLFLAMSLLWVGNGIVYFYPIALIHDCFATVSITIAIVRYNFLGKEPRKKTE